MAWSFLCLYAAVRLCVPVVLNVNVVFVNDCVRLSEFVLVAVDCVMWYGMLFVCSVCCVSVCLL